MQLTAEHISVVLILINVYVSYQGFSKPGFQDQYIFDVDRILIGKEYYRMISSGFLHSGWVHLLFNMYTLYIFSSALATPVIGLGILPYLVVYFGSLIGGDVVALVAHRNHGDYRALGASGAVSGVMFAAIIIFPGMEVSFIYPPVPIPAWIFAVGYVLLSIYGAGAKLGNIGHEAHLGGAVAGMLIGILFRPQSLTQQPGLIAAILIPTVIFLIVLIKQPEFLYIPYLKSRLSNLRHRPRMKVIKNPEVTGGRRKSDFANREEELNYLLDKVNKVGMKGLSAIEKRRLEELSGGRGK
ncbi:MAG: rhomboid family intramembrane serine protease [Bacteroidia bacterium]|nr:rhomboid family intramembrane serine protease [Bacteroidia bacterium]